MSETETNKVEETTQAGSRPRRERKGRAAAKKNDTSDATTTAVVTGDATTDDGTDSKEAPRNRKSTETTFQKQNFIYDLLKKNGEMSINQLMEATFAHFRTRIAFDKAKEAKAAWQNGTEIKKRDGRRDRRGRNMRRHASQMTMVVVVENKDDSSVVKQTYLCADDQGAIQQATKLTGEGTPTENIQIYVRYSASAEVSFG